jgi:hypothetical protein
VPIPIEERNCEQWRGLRAWLPLEGENVNTYLQGRKITATQDYERPSVEALHLIRKLRWIGMEEEAERVETQLHETTLAGGVITVAHETD